MRLDAYLAQAIPEISRARVQLLIEAGQVRVDGAVPKAKHKLHGGEAIEIEGEPQPEPLHATPEDIPLDILYEDKYLAVVNKPAGMMVHAGAGSTDDARNRGTLVNALLHHMAKLSDNCRRSAASCGPASCTGWTSRPAARSWWPRTTSPIASWARCSPRGASRRPTSRWCMGRSRRTTLR